MREPHLPYGAGNNHPSKTNFYLLFVKTTQHWKGLAVPLRKTLIDFPVDFRKADSATLK